MASTDSGLSSLPPSLSRTQSPTGSEGDSALQIPSHISFPELDHHIDVEHEVTQFVKELDANEGREEFVFRTKLLAQNPNPGGHHVAKPCLLSDSETSREWAGYVATPTSSTGNFDQMSSLKMTYYAFKETTGHKSDIPVSLLAAHLERRESRYPSFLGSRSSVSMTGSTSAGSFRTLQRSPSRRASTEIIYPSLSPQVMEVIESLDSHRKKAENEGNYMEARAAAQRLNGVKILEDNKRKVAMLKRHSMERDESQNAFNQESDERNRLWEEKLHEFHKAVVEHAAKLKRQQIGVLQAFRKRMAEKTPTKPQWSRELLKHRKVQTFLARQGKYLEADEVKRIADRMEHIELQATLAAFAAEMAIKEQALRAKQQNEMEVLLQRAAQGRDELRKTRKLDLERCAQRHKNIVRELRTFQKQEHIKFEHIIEKRVSEFKRSGGSLLLLAETLSDLDSLKLPGIPDCPVGDGASGSHALG